MIKDVRYFYAGQPYRLNGNLFDYSLIVDATKRHQKTYEEFAEEINAADGYLAIHLMPHNPLDGGFASEAFVEHIPELLREKIEKSRRR